MRVLLVTTYYRPHISGLTIHVQRIAEGLAARGHAVTVVTSRYEPSLPATEITGGVTVERVPVWWRVGKGVVAPGMRAALSRQIPRHDILAISLPANPDAVWWGQQLARRHDRPLAVIYVCDVQFASGWRHRLLERACRAAFKRATDASGGVLTSSADYARSSPGLAALQDRTTAIPPPIVFPAVSPLALTAFRHRWNLSERHHHVVLAARLASEKGVEYLLAALPEVERRAGPVRLIITGDQTQVVGESAYRRRLEPALAACDPPVVFTGELSTDDMASCFAAGDVTVLPSINQTESFGMVQVESMLCGTPVVASSLPGVREPVTRTGMGLLVPPRDVPALARAITSVLCHRARYRRPRHQIEEAYDSVRALERTEAWLSGIVGDHLRRRQRQRELVAEFRRQARSVPGFRALVRSVEAHLLRSAAPFEAPVLDLGCGDGHFAAAVGGGFDVGLDPDAASIGEARRRGAHRALVRADGTSMPFGNRTFGTIVANSTLEHVESLDAVIREVARVLRPGGRLVMTVPSHRFGDMLAVPTVAVRLGLRALAARYVGWFNTRSRHVTTEGPGQWRRRLDAQGLRVTRSEYYLSARAHRLFDVLHYAALPNLAAR
ncbi:MAG: glycosyltransferase, partial [Acidobacteria bacterium]|nr:glycosyltransferase [Acidobacteriota bacterium]